MSAESDSISCFASDLIPDCWRYIIGFLLTRESINMEIALGETFFTAEQYKLKYRYEPRSLTKKKYHILCQYYKASFQIEVKYMDKYSMIVFDRHSVNSDRALEKVSRLLGLGI